MNQTDSNKQINFQFQSSYTIKSNEQRLKSIDQHEKEKLQRKRFIKDSLNNVTTAKHLKFDDEDNQGQPFVESKLKLFDDDELFNVDKHFNEKKSSKTHRKLQTLQSKLTTTNDPRFQLSEQFLDDQQLDETIEEHQEISIEEEKNKSLAILDQITNGKSSTLSSKPKTKMIRFDPTKSEHRIYEFNSNGQSSSLFNQTQPNSILKVTKNITPILDATRTYQLDSSKLKSLFDKNKNIVEQSNDRDKFQFQFFNNDHPAILPTVNSTIKSISNMKKRIFPNQPEDSSTDEENDKKIESTIDDTNAEGLTISKNFFFFDLDDRLKDGLNNFIQTEDLTELERSWPTKRKEIAEALRTKHRKAIQRKDKQRVLKHRHHHQQNGSSKPKTDLD